MEKGAKITVTARLRTFRKNEKGELEVLAKYVEPLESGRTLVLEVKAPSETLTYKKKTVIAVQVQKLGHRASDNFYIMENEIGSEFDESNPHPGHETKGHHVY